jgi:3-hydroxy acid dehydrogenase / malonic semialdehyde reductase
MEKRMKALVTGASSGFGKAIAENLAKNNYDLILCGRRTSRLEELSESLTKGYNINCQILSFDVRDKEAVEAASKEVSQNELDVLVNNAGLAVGLSNIDNGEIDDWERMLDTNVKGLLYVSRFFLPSLKNGGHVINIGSIAGKEVYPGGNVYCASKHAVDALSKAMRIELLEREIKVSQVCPGMAETEFSLVRFKGDEKRADNVYKGIDALMAIDIAEAVDFILSRPKHVCINDLIIMPSAQATASISKRRSE